MKKCILHDNRFCNDCGECMRCDIVPGKLCDNCGKCIDADEGGEFRSVLLSALSEGKAEIAGERYDGDFQNVEYASEFDSDEAVSDEQRLINAFLDAPIEIGVPEPIYVDPELSEKWERILAEDAIKHSDDAPDDTPAREISLYGKRKRRRRELH